MVRKKKNADVTSDVTSDVTFVDEHHVLGVLETYYQHRRPTLLVGEPGVGKTTLVEQIARQHGARLIQKTGGDYSVAKLVGQHELLAVDGATTTRFVKGPLVRAIECGAVFYLDEISSCRENLQVLHQILDYRKAISKSDIGLTVNAGEEEYLYPHKNFWFVATCIETHRLPADFLDRFRVLVLKRLSIDKQIEVLTEKFASIPVDVIERIVRIGNLTVRLGWLKPASFRQIDATLVDIENGIESDTAIASNLINPNVSGDHDRISLREAMNAEGLSANKIFADVVTPKDKFRVEHFELELDEAS